MTTRGIILLADGSTFFGRLINPPPEPIIGEIVFSTSTVGYQEVITDPSFAGQMVVMTFPVQGIYGADPLSSESNRVQAKAMITKEIWDEAEERDNRMQLTEFLRASGTVIVSGVDTRALTRHIRRSGSMQAIIAPSEIHTLTELQALLKDAPDADTENHISTVTLAEPALYTPTKPKGRLALIDLGLKKSLLHPILQRGYAVTVLPASISAPELLKLEPDGVILSNGPGNPELLIDQINLVKALLGKIPLFGICLGFQLIVLACGGATHKLTHGHRGTNYPVRNLGTGKIEITTQNHGFAVDEDSLAGTGLSVSHRNLNDETVEGAVHRFLPVSGVQFYPANTPGSNEATDLFDHFIRGIQREQAS